MSQAPFEGTRSNSAASRSNPGTEPVCGPDPRGGVERSSQGLPGQNFRASGDCQPVAESFLPCHNAVIARADPIAWWSSSYFPAHRRAARSGHGNCSITGHGRFAMAVKPQILIVDDEEDSRAGLETLLGTWGYATDVASQGREALEKVPQLRPSLVITDLMMPDMDGLALLTALQQEMPRVPVIILTGRATVDTAVGAMRQGAYDYLTKPVDLDRLRLLIEKALDRARTLDEITILRRRVKDVWGMGRLIGRSAPMQEVHRLIEQAAADRRARADPRRDRHRQGAGGPHPARALRPRGRPLRGGQLRGHAGDTAGERDLRPRAGRLHRRARPARGLLRAGPRRHAPPRRGGGDGPRAPRPSSSACSRRARSGGSAARARSRWTCAWWPPPTRTRSRP